jgi:hypothetical protein
MKTVRRLAGQVAAVTGASSGAPRFLAWAVREWVRVHLDSLREWVWPSRPATR